MVFHEASQKVSRDLSPFFKKCVCVYMSTGVHEPWRPEARVRLPEVGDIAVCKLLKMGARN